MRATARANATDNLQLDLFGLTAPKITIYENAHEIRPNGREALAGVPSENDRPTGSEEPVARIAFGGRGKDGDGTGSASPAIDETGIDGAAGGRPSMGTDAGEIHPPDGRVAVNEHPTPDTESAVEEFVKN